MEVIAQDQPGLLHNVARSLRHQGIKLLSAKISTFGERAEDVFFVQRHDHTPVTDEGVLDKLKSEICQALDRSVNTKKSALDDSGTRLTQAAKTK